MSCAALFLKHVPFHLQLALLVALITIYFGGRLKLKQKFPTLPADIFLSNLTKGLKNFGNVFLPAFF